MNVHCSASTSSLQLLRLCCVSCMFFSMKSFVRQILINMIFTSFEISSHFSCLLPAVPLSILFTPMLICFTPKRLLCFECCLELLRCLLHMRNCRVDPCGEIRFDAVHVPCVDFLLQSQPLGSFSCCHHIGQVRAPTSHAVKIHRWDGLDHFAKLQLTEDRCFPLMAIPSACPCWASASVLGCFGTGWLQALDLRLVHFVLVVLLCLPGL